MMSSLNNWYALENSSLSYTYLFFQYLRLPLLNIIIKLH